MKILPSSPREWWQLGGSVVRFYTSPRVPRPLKAGVLLLSALYFVLPLDVLFDFIPLVGRLDDLSVVALVHLGAVLWARQRYALDGPTSPQPKSQGVSRDPDVKTVDVPAQSS